ncbi:glucose-1-phosphate thymidylyltransferase [Thermomonospora umbrina]|uniref:Glucose-1-phosphate thymidylyltransferase n=1 Tax=Thermomonospora umbrina TaxID=111806 RepID=A0A3D9STW1_9ACTN|nr:glucose-1-phosphate thymidylyltransferase [Thermomonospora umbrina]REE99047.1 glucose-1-phosphate thymidylyltransferase [Thermomonospora umbrina]
MKALVLSGGKGTRLRPFTYSMAKQLVPVAGKPVLLHVLEDIRGIGVSEVGIVVGDHAAEIRSVVGDGAELGLRITYLHQAAPLGLAHCVSLAADFLGDDDFVMYLGDNVFVDGIGEAAAMFAGRRPDAQLTVVKVPDPRQYGVAEVGPDGRVRALVEKPREPRSNLAITGVYFLTPAIHEAVRAIRPSARGELEITDALQHLVARGGTVVAQEHAGFWKDTGNVAELLECNRVLLERLPGSIGGRVDADSAVHGTVVVEPGAVVTRSRLVGPLIVGAGSRVVDSRVGPGTALGRDCVVRDADVEDSILLEGARVQDVRRLRRSVIGRWTDVRATGAPGGHSLIIGDHTRAWVAA